MQHSSPVPFPRYSHRPRQHYPFPPEIHDEAPDINPQGDVDVGDFHGGGLYRRRVDNSAERTQYEVGVGDIGLHGRWWYDDDFCRNWSFADKILAEKIGL